MLLFRPKTTPLYSFFPHCSTLKNPCFNCGCTGHKKFNTQLTKLKKDYEDQMVKLRKTTDEEVQRYKTIIESLEKVSNIRSSKIDTSQSSTPVTTTTKKPTTIRKTIIKKQIIKKPVEATKPNHQVRVNEPKQQTQVVKQQSQPRMVKKPAPIGPVRMPQIARSNIVRGAAQGGIIVWKKLSL